MTKGCVEGLYVKHLLERQGFGEMTIKLWTDSSGAKAISKRLGPGKKAKHLEVQTFWVQQIQREGLVETGKVGTEDNNADILTKYVPRAILDKLMYDLGFTFPNKEKVQGGGL